MFQINSIINPLILDGLTCSLPKNITTPYLFQSPVKGCKCSLKLPFDFICHRLYGFMACITILMTFCIQFRVGYGSPLFHSYVLLIRFIALTLYVAIMINMVCYCVLKCANIFFFDTINKILDQTLLNIVKVFSVGVSFLLVAADTYWKVRSSWFGQQILGNVDVVKKQNGRPVLFLN